MISPAPFIGELGILYTAGKEETKDYTEMIDILY